MFLNKTQNPEKSQKIDIKKKNLKIVNNCQKFGKIARNLNETLFFKK